MADKNSAGELEEMVCCRNAIQCAEEIKNYSSVDLNSHVAVSYGEICFAILGGHESQWTYLINGECLTELADALNDAASREAVATATCFAKAHFDKSDIKVTEISGKDSVKIIKVIKNDHEKDCNSEESRSKFNLMFAELHHFVPSPVCAAVAAGSFDVLSELRQVTTLFLKLDSYSREKNKDLLSLQSFYLGVQKYLADMGGFMRQFLVDDKGCVLIALWGVPGTNHPNNCSRALHCGVSIRNFCKTIDHQCSIGLTTGDAYCGTVGSEIRKDYVAMGDAVNLAARLMCKADGRLLMDSSTHSELPQSLSSIMKVGKPLMLKGRSEPLCPYVYEGDELPPLDEGDINADRSNLIVDKEVVTLLEKEMSSLASFQNTAISRLTAVADEHTHDEESLANFHENTILRELQRVFYPPVRLILLVGPSGSGKGNAVKLFTMLSKKLNFRRIHLRLTQTDSSSPYGAIRKLFLVLIGQTNFITEENQRSVLNELFSDCYPNDDLQDIYRKHFPMFKFVLNLDWDYEDMYNVPISRAYEFMGDPTIQEVLSFLFKQYTTTVVIEDVNFCDELSWRELLCVLDTKSPVLMLFTGLNVRDVQDKRRLASRMTTTSSIRTGSAHSLFPKRTKSELPQVSVATETTRQTKVNVYGGLSALDDGSWRESKGPTISSTVPNQQTAAQLLLTTRREYRDYSSFKDHENCTYINMSLLAEWEVEDLLKSTLGEVTIPPALPAEVQELCGGSVYWCNSIANYIKVVGIEKFNEEWTEELHDVDKWDNEKFFEESRKSRTTKRLERHIVYHLESLSVKLQSVSKFASVIGDFFPLRVLFQILPSKVCVSMNDLTRCVTTLTTEGILDLINADESVYSFQNEKIRNTLMNFVLPSDADRIHCDIARSYEKLFESDLRPHFPSLSYHYAMSPVAERGNAFKYTVNAADQQIGNGNFQAGYLYLEYAASFVKYDMEMKILSHVTETALYDLKQQKKLQKKLKDDVAGRTIITEDDLVNFEDMNDKFKVALTALELNSAKILVVGSYDGLAASLSTDSNCEKAYSDAVFMAVKDKQLDKKKKKKKHIARRISAKDAKFLKMPSYSAKHPQNRKNRIMACCTVS
jgi:hypothetical protein